jgi:DNA-binding beta-propeller fold protein YncE
VPDLDLAASSDGKFVYALNSQTNDVTIIDSGDGKVLGHVAVGGGARRVLLSPGGEFLCAQSNKDITLIDTQSNPQHVKHKVLSGKVTTLQVDETGRTLLTLTSKTLEVWDSEQGKTLATVDGLAEPQFVVTPNPIEAR